MADTSLTAAQAERLHALERARSLDDLVELTGADSPERAYLEAKADWRALKDTSLPLAEETGFPGDSVEIDGHTFHVHGITHTDTAAERAFVRQHVSDATGADAFVYCEQGIRSMYFADMTRVCEMDDYRWALQRCRDLDRDSHLEMTGEVDSLLDDLSSVTNEFRTALFSLIESSSDFVGEQATQSLGDLAASLLTHHSDLGVGRDYTSFVLSRRASKDPSLLGALQRYYRTAFLPQPIEREWLKGHDPELEIITHARNERMADYVVNHNEQATQVLVIVGAAHQPGVTYYLRQYQSGERTEDSFELVE